MSSIDTSKVSVIIPTYNCGKYIQDCVESVLSQTYENIEVVVVNDGSTDDTEKTLELIAQEDARLVVVNKMNEGVAKARNEGGQIATGEYVMFVDGDDCVADTYVEKMIELVKKYQADMAICGLQTFYDKADIVNQSVEEITETTYTNVEALEKLLYRNGITSSPCTKIIRREYFLKYPFPENTLYEDLGVVYKWIVNTEKVAYSTEKLYYYLLRQGSAQRSEFRKQKMDLYILSEQIVDYVKDRFPMSISAAYNRMFVSCLQLLRDIPSNGYEEEYRLVIKQIQKLRKIILLDKKSRFSTRVLAFGACINIPMLKVGGTMADMLIYKLKIKKAF